MSPVWTNTPQQLEVYSTGYYDLPQGIFEDPLTHAHAQRAVVHARVYFDNVDKVLIGVPGQLKINPGATVSDAIYAADLVFVKGDTTAHIDSAFYSHSMTRDDGTPFPGVDEGSNSYVTFGVNPSHLGYPLHFSRLGAATQAYYKPYATSIASQLSDGRDLDGLVPAPQGSDLPVYYCDGDLDIGKNAALSPGGSFIVYITGNLKIHNFVASNTSAWIVFLVEKDIEIESVVPSNLVLNGTFIANGKIAAIGGPRPGILTINGSLIAGEGMDLATTWNDHRNYFHRQADPALPLPHLTELIDYTVVQGKYQ